VTPATKAGEQGEVVSEVEILLQGYSSYLEMVCGKSPNTAKGYTLNVRRWLEWWKRPPEFFREPEWDDWTASLSGSGLKASSIIAYQVCVRRFFRYLRRRKILSHDPANECEPLRKSKSLPTWLSVEEVDRVLAVSDSVKDTAILETLYSCGLRSEELRALKLGNLLAGDLIQLTGKGRKERVVPLPAKAKAAMGLWLEERPTDTDWVFPSTHRRSMSTRTLNNLIHRLVKSAGITKRITPHTFRHSIATHLASKGVPIERIQLFLGHDSPETTMIYVHLAAALVQKAILDVHPRG
jgi:integrase/recombinase XerD